MDNQTEKTSDLIPDRVIDELANRAYTLQSRRYEELVRAHGTDPIAVPPLSEVGPEIQQVWCDTVKEILDAFCEVAFDRNLLVEPSVIQSGQRLRAAEVAFDLMLVLCGGDLDERVARDLLKELNFRLGKIEGQV